MNNLNIDDWLQKIHTTNQSKYTLLQKWIKRFMWLVDHESNYNYSQIPNLRRGQIIFLDFGYRVHNEFRYPHYAVVLHKSGKPNHNVTVVPITSKNKKHSIPIGTELVDQLESVIFLQERSAYWQPFRQLVPEIESRGIKTGSPAVCRSSQAPETCSRYIRSIKQRLNPTDDLHHSLNKILVALKEFDELLKSTPKLAQNSFLLPEQITTVSKARIIAPKKKTHVLNYLRLTDNTMNILDKEIIKLFTNPNIDKNSN